MASWMGMGSFDGLRDGGRPRAPCVGRRAVLGSVTNGVRKR
ncbi:hypothetical protein BSIN_1220 [Burkholderia singularis]|uniref:Uncharacterized protein n=1 Tax=Burkholderia singularis TaxID=1503053 RepID=A0A238HDK6_9BURK|nr:hypothetical protein BSIN_1220 [Burkholderia singularis]